MQTLKKDTLYDIDGGPDKELVLVQLHDIGRFSKHRPTVEFTLKQNDAPALRVNVLINSVTAEDGSGFCWLISGYLPDTNQKFASFYDTRYRKGWFRIL